MFWYVQDGTATQSSEGEHTDTVKLTTVLCLTRQLIVLVC